MLSASLYTVDTSCYFKSDIFIFVILARQIIAFPPRTFLTLRQAWISSVLFGPSNQALDASAFSTVSFLKCDELPDPAQHCIPMFPTPGSTAIMSMMPIKSWRSPGRNFRRGSPGAYCIHFSTTPWGIDCFFNRAFVRCVGVISVFSHLPKHAAGHTQYRSHPANSGLCFRTYPDLCFFSFSYTFPPMAIL